METPITPFLQEVARQYAVNESENLSDFCFVTPNKRTATFLKKFLREEMAKADCGPMLPEVTTISDFVASFSSDVEASVFEQLFILYNVYSEIITSHSTPEMIESGANLIDFNKFQFWGGVLLNDFNDVDKYLVDAKQLFRNVETLKEISANYLTPEQIEVIKRYWNEEDIPQPAKEFWNHVVYKSGRAVDNKKNAGGFVRLWQVMNEIYGRFRDRLKEKGMTYSGKLYRDLCDYLSICSADDLEYKRYVFVGFNVLSASEREIFSRLKRYGIADFYWDYASPAFDIRSNSAIRFLQSQIKEFPSLYEAGRKRNDWPEIYVKALPSSIGQTKILPKVLSGLHPEIFNENLEINRSVSQESLIDTAVVLPDEHLCLPLLHSLPSGLDNLNVTMGFSLRNAPVATLVRNIISMQLRARMLKFDNTFYFEDIIAVLTHPLVRLASSEACDSIVAMINQRRLFNIPLSELIKEEYASLRPIFEVVSNNNDPDAVFGYLSRLMIWLRGLIEKRYDIEENGTRNVEESEDDASASSRSVELGFIQAYEDSIAELRRLDHEYLRGNKVFLADKTVFHLVERIIGHKTVSFEGVPLRGLQIMGVLETRNLDFDNLVVMSMNERVFPRRHYSKSMIPNALRRAYGMSTLEHQESIYAYYFYRMISRAKRVVLLYDGRNEGAKSGQPSRYLNQLRFIVPPEKFDFRPLTYRLSLPDFKHQGVEKTPAVMKKLSQFLSGNGKRCLSASSINTFINCPLQFYLMNIERFYEADEMKDYMDDSTYGTIVHETIQWIYEGEQKRLGVDELVVDEAMLERFSDSRLIGYYLERSIKKNYLKQDPDDQTPLYGDSELFKTIITQSIRLMLSREKELLPFSFKCSEVDERIDFKLPAGTTINLNFRIDRVDVVRSANDEHYIRLIDYKTGGDVATADDIKSLFDSNNEQRNKAMMQLLLYSNAYAQRYGFEGRIEPILYRMRKMAVEKIKPLSIRGIESNRRYQITDYRDVNEEFMQFLEEKIQEMFNPEIPFAPNPSRSHCNFCQFKEICGQG